MLERKWGVKQASVTEKVWQSFMVECLMHVVVVVLYDVYGGTCLDSVCHSE